jgi:hypothetical protein
MGVKGKHLTRIAIWPVPETQRRCVELETGIPFTLVLLLDTWVVSLTASQTVICPRRSSPPTRLLLINVDKLVPVMHMQGYNTDVSAGVVTRMGQKGKLPALTVTWLALVIALRYVVLVTETVFSPHNQQPIIKAINLLEPTNLSPFVYFLVVFL